MSLRPLALVAGLLLAPVAVACGDDSYGGPRPSQSDLSDRIQNEVGDDLTEAQADCIAEELLASDLSDDVLNALERNIDEDNVPDDEQEAAETMLTQAAMSCLGA